MAAKATANRLAGVRSNNPRSSERAAVLNAIHGRNAVNRATKTGTRSGKAYSTATPHKRCQSAIISTSWQLVSDAKRIQYRHLFERELGPKGDICAQTVHRKAGLQQRSSSMPSSCLTQRD